MLRHPMWLTAMAQDARDQFFRFSARFFPQKSETPRTPSAQAFGGPRKDPQAMHGR